MSPRPAAFHDPLSVPRAGAAVPRPESPYEADKARRQHFSAYFDERYHKDRRRQAERREDKKKDDGPRKHHWTFTEILWTYRYTMIAAIHTSQNQFGEAPVFLPLLRRAMTMLDVKEIGGDKAYDANYIYQFAKQHGIEAQIKVRDTGFPSYSHSGKKYRKAHMLAARLDPEGFAAKANRRNNAETGNHAFKAVLGDQIYSKSAQAQRCEILCMCIAYNLTRLVLLEVERQTALDFAGGLERLARPSAAAVEGRALRPSGPPRGSGLPGQGFQPGIAAAWRTQDANCFSSSSSSSLMSRPRASFCSPTGGTGLSDVPRKNISFTCLENAANATNQPCPSMP